MRKNSVLALSLMVTCAVGTSALGSAPASDPDPAKELAEQRMATMTDPSAMQNWMKVMQPSLGHKVLEKFVGNWDVETKLWMDPSAPPMVSQAKSTSKTIFGGRYVETDYRGAFMGQPYHGKGTMGYDNGRKLFNNIWLSSMDTGMHVAMGNLNMDGSILTMVGEMDEPMSGEIGKTYRMLYHFKSDDKIVFEMQEILYGEPFVVMEFTYTRNTDPDWSLE